MRRADVISFSFQGERIGFISLLYLEVDVVKGRRRFVRGEGRGG